jgi:hypothetical protein
MNDTLFLDLVWLDASTTCVYMRVCVISSGVRLNCIIQTTSQYRSQHKCFELLKQMVSRQTNVDQFSLMFPVYYCGYVCGNVSDTCPSRARVRLIVGGGNVYWRNACQG